MLNLPLNRRQTLQVCGAGVIGSSLPFAASPTFANDSRKTADTVLIVHCSGGQSQLETFDMKPDAALEIRGEFQPIDTTIPGISVCEHLPKLAQHMDRWSIIRTLAHSEGNHLLATHVALTGRPTPIPRGTASDLDRVESRNDFPNLAAALDYLQPRTDGIPNGVSLPNYFIEGALTWPGQHAGFLGAKHDPWQINQDPNAPNFRIDSLSLQNGLTPPRLTGRRQLLDGLNQSPTSERQTREKAFLDQQEVAFGLLTSDKVAKAFQIEHEDSATRERYGRNKYGQSLLLARRLVEAGVPIVQAAMGHVQTWDTHVDNWGRQKNVLLPQLDTGLAALMDDLAASGRLERTMVVVMGEFGRTPKVSYLPGESLPGRDHWPFAYSALFGGAGIRGGQVLGQTDQIAAWPLSRSWSPADVLTTLLSSLGVSHDAILYDPLGRPNHLLNGEVIEPLYSGRQV